MRDDEPIRYRVWFGKGGPLRYISHLDLARLWERALRRAQAPVIYSQGFNPHPKIQLAAALPLGYSSTCEILDIWLEKTAAPAPDELLARLQNSVPPGVVVARIEKVGLHAPALQAVMRSATYEVRIKAAIETAELPSRIAALLAEQNLPRARRDKTYNLRPLVHHLALVDSDPPTLRMTLAVSQESGTGRPDEVLAALGLDPVQAQITRTALHFEEQGCTKM